MKKKNRAAGMLLILACLASLASAPVMASEPPGEKETAEEALPDEPAFYDEAAEDSASWEETAASEGMEIEAQLPDDGAVSEEPVYEEPAYEEPVWEAVQEEPEQEDPAADNAAETEDMQKEDPEAPDEPEAEEEEPEEVEAEESEPAQSTRLLVKTDDASILDEDAVIAVMDDVYLLQFPSEEEAGEALEAYEDEAVYAAEDLTIRAASYGDFDVAEGEAEIIMTETDNPFAEAEKTGPVAASGCLVALIDTGVSGAKDVSGRYSVLGDDGMDRNGHGDAMLDTIRAYDPEAEVASIKALDDAGIGTVSSLYAAIRMAIDMQASVINLSLSAYSTRENEAVSSIIREAVQRGIIVVGASGNNDMDAANFIPANIDEAVIVSACSRDGSRLPSSNYGSTVDLFVLAGSSSYAAATLSGIISNTGSIPAPDGNAVFAPGGSVAPSDYVDGLCYDGMSGNFSAAGTSYTVHNAGGRRLSDLIPSLTYESLDAWLGSHENDSYYLGTPYPERIVNGVPQYILGRSGDCDNRNPNGDCGDIHGNDDYAGVAMMNCTGFVWHALWKASGLSYTEGINRIPAWGGIGAGSWKSFIQNNNLEYMTVKSGGTNEINEMLDTAMHSATGPDGKIFLEKGDIIWFWVDQIPLGSDDLPVNGYFGGLADKAHVGIYWPETKDNDNRWWDSIGICEYEGEDGYYLRNMLHHFTPKTGSVAMTIIKLDHSKPALTKVSVQKTSENAGYSFAGAVYGVYGTRADAEAKTNAVTTITTGEDGYGESEEVLDVGETYYIREISPPSNGVYLADPDVHEVTTVEADEVTRDTAIVSPETMVRGGVKIRKQDSAGKNGEPQGDASLSGAGYSILNAEGNVVLTLATDAAGVAESAADALLYGDYTAAETDPSAGYMRNGGWKQAFSIRENGKVIDLSENPCDEAVIRGGVKIKKTDADLKKGTAQGDASLDQAAYTITNRSSAPVYVDGKWYETGAAVKTITTNDKGEAQTEAGLLPYGTYEIAETEASSGYRVNSSWKQTFQIREAGKVVDLTGSPCEESVIRGGVRIRKQDSEYQDDASQGDASLAGAQFTITNRSRASVVVAGVEYAPGTDVLTIRTDEAGMARTPYDALPFGTYEIREISPSAGYLLNEDWKQAFEIREDGKTTDLTEGACDEAVIRGGVLVEKRDRELEANEALGGASLAGIEFTICNASPLRVRVSGESYEPEAEILKVYTDEEGHASLPGDCLPYGTYAIKETGTNETYLLSDGERRIFEIREDGKTVTVTDQEEDLNFQDQAVRSDFRFNKIADGSNGRMEKTAFVITQLKTGEQHVIVTDRNGVFNSGSRTNPHFQNTNGNDFVLEKYADDVIPSEELDYKAGLWFGLGQKGSEAEADDSLGALPYGDYRLRELPCESNIGYKLLDIRFCVETDKSAEPVIDLGTLTDDEEEKPEIRTTAAAEDTGSHETQAGKKVTIIDTVTYTNLTPGKEYTMHGTLMSVPSDGKEAQAVISGGETVKAETVFTPEKPDGTIGMTFTFDASALAGMKTVVFEEVRSGSLVIAEHADAEDEDQQVSFIDIGTAALAEETEAHEVQAAKKVTITDTVRYNGLAPGRKYEVKGVLMDAETGEELLVNGKRVTAHESFSPSEPDGSAEVTFTLKAADLAGKKTVVFEDLYRDGKKIASHADLTDEGQTVAIIGIGTNAADKTTGTHESQAAEETVFTDTVRYAGLTPGKTYTVKGTLMDEGTGKELLAGEKPVTAEKTFVPETAEGTVTIEFALNTSDLAGKTAVVFEDLYHDDTMVASHADIKDAAQSIHVIGIGTAVRDRDSGTQEAKAKADTVLIDTVEYTGLTKGETYILKGTLMDADTGEELILNGGTVTAEAKFRAKGTDGTAEVEFTLDSTELDGKSIVVFEDLYHDGVKVASHADRNDRNQTMSFHKPETEPAPDPTPEPTPEPEKPKETPKPEKPTAAPTPAATPSVTPTVTPVPSQNPARTNTTNVTTAPAGKTSGKTLIARPVRTGDTSHMIRYLLIMAAAGAASAAAAVIRKKRK